MKLTGGGKEWIYEGQGRVLFQMAPEPHLPWEVLASVEDESSDLETATSRTLVVPDFAELTFEDPVSTTPVIGVLRRDHAKERFSGGLVRTPIGDADNLSELRYHLLDFPLRAGAHNVLYPNGKTFPGRISLAADEWLIDIDIWPDWERIQGLTRGEVPINFVRMCRIRHKDGLLFSTNVDRVESLRCTLILFLSFVAGRSVGAALPVGFDESGKKQYVEWSSTIVDMTRGLDSWYPRGNPDCIPQLFTQFIELAKEPHWHRTLVTLIRSYTAVGSSWADFGFAVGVAFIAFASLSQKILVLEESELSQAQFKSNPTHKNLQMLLKWAGIPVTVPDGLLALSAAARDKGMGAPRLLAWIRNRMIHPVNRDDLDRDAVQEAWTLCLWYLELLMLRLLSYEGTYHCRVNPSESPRGYALVPWVAQRD